MERRAFVTGIAAVMLAGHRRASAQQTVRHVRIGVLAAPAAAHFASRTEALRAGLQDFGYVEGKNLLIEFRSADGRYERLAALATELIRAKVDVIVTAGTPAIGAAKQATRTVPIVITAVRDAVAGGLVDSLAKPGGNITGATYLAPELAAKLLEILKQVVPHTTRVAVIMNPDNPAMRSTLPAVA